MPSDTERKPALAVLPYNDNTGDPKSGAVGRALAETASAALMEDGRLLILERDRLPDIMAELKLNGDGHIDPASAVRIGQLIGADLILFGSYSRMDNQRLVTARVVSVETSRILGASVTAVGNDGIDSASRTGAHAAVDAALALFQNERVREGPRASESAYAADEELLRAMPPAPSKLPGAVGVVIGVSEYAHKDVPAARYAIRDARAIKAYLINSLGLLDNNVYSLENPTKAELEAFFGTAANARGKLRSILGRKTGKTSLFVYYSGHGAPGLRDHRGYLVPADADPAFLELSGYPRDIFLRNISSLKYDRATVVLEACFSGGYDGGTLIGNASPLLAKLNDNTPPAGIELLSSSTSEQISSWYPEKRHSLFTYVLLDELRTRLARNPKAPFSEVSRAVAVRVGDHARRSFDRQQEPQFSGDAGRPFGFE